MYECSLFYDSVCRTIIELTSHDKNINCVFTTRDRILCNIMHVNSIRVKKSTTWLVCESSSRGRVRFVLFSSPLVRVHMSTTAQNFTRLDTIFPLNYVPRRTSAACAHIARARNDLSIFKHPVERFQLCIMHKKCYYRYVRLRRHQF